MTTLSIEERARCFMQYGEVGVLIGTYYRSEYYYLNAILYAAESHLKDLTAAIDTWCDGGGITYAELYQETFDDLDNLSLQTLAILAKIVEPKLKVASPPMTIQMGGHQHGLDYATERQTGMGIR